MTWFQGGLSIFFLALLPATAMGDGPDAATADNPPSHTDASAAPTPEGERDPDGQDSTTVPTETESSSEEATASSADSGDADREAGDETGHSPRHEAAVQPPAISDDSSTSTAGLTLGPPLEVEAINEVFDYLETEVEVPVTATATGTEQRLDETPAIVEVISAEDIRNAGYRTVAEVLRYISGFAVIDDFASIHAGVRGLFASAEVTNDIFRVMINGQRTAFRPSSSNYLGAELIPIEAVERIDVIRGPASALYGANAFLGVINIITHRRARPGRNHEGLASIHGQYATQTQRFGAGASTVARGQVNDYEYLISGAFRYRDRSGLRVPGSEDIARQLGGEPTVGAPSPGIDRLRWGSDSPSSNDTEFVGTVYGQVDRWIGPGSLTVDGSFQWVDRGAEWLPFAALSHLNRLAFTNAYARVRYQVEPPDEGWFGKASLAVSHAAPTSANQIAVPTQETITRPEMSSLAFDALVELGHRFSPDHTLTFGLDLTADVQELVTLRQFRRDDGTPLTGDEPLGTKFFFNTGLYTQWLYSPLPGLGFVAGARADYNNVASCASDQWDCLGEREDDPSTSNDDGRGVVQLSARAGVVYRWPFGGLYTKLLYGSSFKPPSPFQLFHSPVGRNATAGFEFLQSQTADTVEFQIGHFDAAGTEATVTFYHTIVDNMVLFFREGTLLLPRNADGRVTGIEANAGYRFGPRFGVQASFSYLLSAQLSPQRRAGETEFAFLASEYNTSTQPGRFPDVTFNVRGWVSIPEIYLRAWVGFELVGARRASLINNQLFNAASFDRTYSFDPYANVRIHLQSENLHLWDDRETILGLTISDIPGRYSQPSLSGIDVPSQGPTVQFTATQEL